MEYAKLRRTRSYIDPKRKSSSIIIKKVLISNDQQERERINSINSDDDNFELNAHNEETIKRVSMSLATIEKMSRVKLEGIDQNDGLDSVSKDDEDSILQRERGSTKTSEVFFDSKVIERFSVNTLVTNRTSTLHVRVSDNVPVRNMPVDLPPSDDLSAEEADIYANIIDKLLDQLKLIKYTIPAIIDDEWKEDYNIVQEYGNDDFDESEMLINSDDVYTIASNSAAMEKLQQDRTYIYNVLKGTTMDLRLNRRYNYLEEEINNIVKASEANHDLKINYEIREEQLTQLNELIVDEKLNSEIHVRKLLKSVHESGAKIEEAIFLCSSRLGYIEKWERVRLDQQKLLLKMKEQMLQDELNNCMGLENVDDIVSNELRSFLHTDVIEKEEEIEIRSSQYYEEIDQRQKDIDYFNERIKDAREALDRNYKFYDKRQAFIDEFEKEKREKVKEAEYRMEIHKAATIIQSIWRGYMVRHQLAQYQQLWDKLKKLSVVSLSQPSY
ncbi:hypothetical protein PV327_008892 [Microctonus hyperodae]|uniref:Dynein regulatory complex protein 9 n=1 Tax=Microctonus hyperodae TaxID=165561 RepID=A0AA39FSM7_MICHY|nr:hypothetical protein PV327_008892 [Microctonus hyperodae]